jgi:hypothetical protein
VAEIENESEKVNSTRAGFEPAPQDVEIFYEGRLAALSHVTISVPLKLRFKTPCHPLDDLPSATSQEVCLVGDIHPKRLPKQSLSFNFRITMSMARPLALLALPWTPKRIKWQAACSTQS